MKKIKFLNGMSAIFAFAAVALATTFTSCEKEEFNVKFEPNPAKITFTPTVIDAGTNVDVTAKADFGGTIAEITGSKDIAKGSREITATVNGVSGSVTVNYEALAAGQTVNYSPVILLDSKYEGVEVEASVELGTPGERIYGNFNGEFTHDHANSVWGINATDYYFPYKATWNEKATLKVIDKEIYSPSFTLSEAIENKEFSNEGESVEFKASAWSMFTAYYVITPATVTYTWKSVASDKVVAKVVYNNPIYKIEAAAEEKAAPGHEHAYEHGHGHGNNPNAGGGIVMPE